MSYASLDQSKIVCKKNQGLDSRDEKLISICSNFWDRQTNIVAYGGDEGAVGNQKGSPRKIACQKSRA